MRKSKEYTGINIQYPISELILKGRKTIETRTHPLPSKYIGKEMVLIETPGKTGNFKARMRGVLVFSRCFKYVSENSFYADAYRHHVDKSSQWAWNPSKGKWGWEITLIREFKKPLAITKKKGIVYTTGIRL